MTLKDAAATSDSTPTGRVMTEAEVEGDRAVGGAESAAGARPRSPPASGSRGEGARASSMLSRLRTTDADGSRNGPSRAILSNVMTFVADRVRVSYAVSHYGAGEGCCAYFTT